MQPTHTALVIVVPEAEPAVAPWRAALDRAASLGVPAHITVLYPFLSPERIGDSVLDGLRELRRAADTVSAQLPIRAPVHRVRLMQGSAAPDSWRTVTEFPLGYEASRSRGS